MTVHYIADARGRRIARELVALQDALNHVTQRLLSGKPKSGADEIGTLIEQMDGVTARLRTQLPFVMNAKLRLALHNACDAYEAWNRAKIGTMEERFATDCYLDAVTELRRIAR